MDGGARVEQCGFGVGLVVTIESVVAFQELVGAHNFRAGRGIRKTSVEAHRRSAVGGQFRDGRADARGLVFAERERLVFGGPANESRLERAVARHAIL